MPSDNNLYNAKQLEIFGAGFGMLTFNGDTIEMISNLEDSGQPTLGQPVDIMTIDDQRPRGIIPPMAIQSGTLSMTVYADREKSVFGSILNSHYSEAKDLVDIMNAQLGEGSLELHWITKDVDNRSTKIMTYQGVVVTNVTRNFTVDTKGGRTSTYQITCKYTRLS